MRKEKFLILFLLLASTIFSQNGSSYGFSDATSLSLANTYIARSSGVDAIGINPANLAYPSKYSFNLRTLLPLPSLTIKFRSPIDIQNYNYYFGGVKDANGKTVGRYLTQSEKTDLVELLSESRFITNISLNYFSVSLQLDKSIGAFAFSIVDKSGQSFQFSSSFIEFMFNGNSFIRDYSLSDLDITSSTYREFSLSYAREILPKKISVFNNLYGGITFKLINGYHYLRTVKNNTGFRFIDKFSISGEFDYEVQHAFSPDFGKNYGKDSVSILKNPFSAFPTSAGSGFGVDIGFTTTIENNLKLSLSLTDIGAITWDKNTAVIYGSGNFIFEGYSSKEAMDSLIEKFKKVENKLNTEFSSPLPTTLRIGASYQLDQAPFIKSFPGSLLLAFDYNQGFNNEIGNSTQPRFSLGADWDPGSWIPHIRTGISVGGKMGFEWAFGFGIDANPIQFNFAFLNPVAIFMADKTTKFQFGMDSKWRF